MDAAEYREKLIRLHITLQMIEDIEIDEMLNAISRSHAVGPILDPTLYKANMEKMDEDAELLRSFLPAWKLARELRDRRIESLRNQHPDDLDGAGVLPGQDPDDYADAIAPREADRRAAHNALGSSGRRGIPGTNAPGPEED